METKTKQNKTKPPISNQEISIDLSGFQTSSFTSRKKYPVFLYLHNVLLKVKLQRNVIVQKQTIKQNIILLHKIKCKTKQTLIKMYSFRKSLLWRPILTNYCAAVAQIGEKKSSLLFKLMDDKEKYINAYVRPFSSFI